MPGTKNWEAESYPESNKKKKRQKEENVQKVNIVWVQQPNQSLHRERKWDITRICINNQLDTRTPSHRRFMHNKQFRD